jgi:hypothetical protein
MDMDSKLFEDLASNEGQQDKLEETGQTWEQRMAFLDEGIEAGKRILKSLGRSDEEINQLLSPTSLQETSVKNSGQI